MGRVLSCCATEAPKAAEAVVSTGPAVKPRRASTSKDAPTKGEKREESRDKGAVGTATSRSNASSKGRSGRSSISQKQATNLSTATTTSRSNKQEAKPGESKPVETSSKSSSGGAKSEGSKDKGRRSSTRTEEGSQVKEERKAEKSEIEVKSEVTKVEATPEAPTEKESPEVSADTETKASSKSRRASAKQAKEAVPNAGPPEVLAPVALDDTTPSTSDFVLVRPLPYEPVLPDAGDSNKQRTFVFKGTLIVVPMLPLQSPREGSPKSAKQSKNEDVRQNKGWKMVKSKVVGGAMKVE